MLRAARAEGDPFRIVLTDMQMPEMDGESLGKTIKADPELRDTALVMMTSLGKRGDAKRLEAIGFSAYLTKPVKQSQLYDCLATVLGAGDPSVKTPETALVTRHTLNEARRREVRILLAEDNATNQQVALRILEKLGFRADAVANGREAIQALETVPYDIVLMDVQMPVMDGFEATRAIRSGETKVPDPTNPHHRHDRPRHEGRPRALPRGGHGRLYLQADRAAGPGGGAREMAGPRSENDPPGGRRARRRRRTVPTDPPVFDRQALLARLMGDEDLVKEIIAGFLEDMPKQIAGAQETPRPGRRGIGRRPGARHQGRGGQRGRHGPERRGLRDGEGRQGRPTAGGSPPSCPSWSGSSTCCKAQHAGEAVMKILIAEDDFTSRSILTAILKKWGFDPVVTEDGGAAWDVLQRPDAPELVLLDWNMPGMDGLEICRRLREIDSSNPPYVILLTARGEKGDIVQGLEAGANDYVAKPYDNEELQARIRVGQRMLELQSRLLEARDALAHQATHDPLTGVLNRRAILDRLERGDFAGETGRRKAERRDVRHRPFQEDQRHPRAPGRRRSADRLHPVHSRPSCGNMTVSAGTVERSSS